MSNKNFLSKENKHRNVNDLDDDRMQNNIKKFNFILEDATSIKKKATKEIKGDKPNKDTKLNIRPSSKNNIENLNGKKNKDDPSFYNFQENQDSNDKENLSDQEEINASLSKAKDTDVNFYQFNIENNKKSFDNENLLLIKNIPENNKILSKDSIIKKLRSANSIKLEDEKFKENIINIKRKSEYKKIDDEENSKKSEREEEENDILILSNNKIKDGLNNKNNKINKKKSENEEFGFIEHGDNTKLLNNSYHSETENNNDKKEINKSSHDKNRKIKIDKKLMDSENEKLEENSKDSYYEVENEKRKNNFPKLNMKDKKNGIMQDIELNEENSNEKEEKINKLKNNKSLDLKNLNKNDILIKGKNDGSEYYSKEKNLDEDEKKNISKSKDKNKNKSMINESSAIELENKNIHSNRNRKKSTKLNLMDSKELDIKNESGAYTTDRICDEKLYEQNYINNKNKLKFFKPINNYDYEDEKDNLFNISEHSVFYNNPYFQKGIFQKKKIAFGQEEITPNKNELVIREKLMYFYLNPRKNVAMPKFMKCSEKEKKCQEIMSFTEAKLPDLIDNFYDEKPFLRFRKYYYVITSRVNRFMLKIVKNQFFDNISLMIILLNTLLILMSDPLDSESIANTTDNYFLYYYTAEMCCKIIAFGFIFPENSYLKDTWNILDFLVIFVGWISTLIESVSGGGKIQGLSGLRAFRILRPLKTVKSIKGLRRIIATLLESMLALGDILIVLFFFFLIFSVAGVQMWQGLYLNRCYSTIYGYPLDISDTTTMCSSDDDCRIFNSLGERFKCMKTYVNPNNNCTHFDDTINGLITVFIIATMEGWTDFWNYTSTVFKDSYGINAAIIFLYFHVLLFVGGYYLINLFLAVILNKFSEIESKNQNDNKNKQLSLYAILINTFDRAENDDNLEENKIEDEDLEEKEDKIKNEVGVFKYKEGEIPVSYDVLSDMFLFKTYSPQELYHLKLTLHKEAKKALNEFNEVLNNHKKILKDKLGMRKKTVPLNSENKSNPGTEMPKLKDAKTMIFKRKHTNTNELVEIEKLSIPISIQKTLKFFSDVIKNLKRDALLRQQAKKIKEESSKKKTYLEIINQKMDENTQKEINETSNSENEDDEIKQEKDNEITKKNTSTDDKKTTDEELKKSKIDTNINDNISFSMDTSEDNSSLTNLNEIKEKINDNLNMDSSRRQGDDNSLSKNRTLQQKSLITKKTLINEENDLYNKMIINKPKNPMIEIMKNKEEKIRKKKIDLLREKFNPDEYISNLKPSLRNKIGRGKSFLNVLKFTDENGQERKKETVQDIKNYDDELEENNSLEISKDVDEPIIVETQSDINHEEIQTKSNEEDKFIDFDRMNKQFDENKFCKLSTSSLFDLKKFKKNPLSINYANIFLNNKNPDVKNDFSIDENKRLSNINKFLNKKIQDDNHYNFEDKNNYDLLNNLGNIEKYKKYEKSKSFKFNNSIKNSTQKKIRSFSVKKNGFKFAGVEKNMIYEDTLTLTSNNEKKKKNFYQIFNQEEVSEYLSQTRKYLRYINFCLDKDFKILDEFKVDDFIEDVMGKIDKPTSLQPAIAEVDAAKMFNSEKINSKNSSYLKYKSFDLLEEDYIQMYNNLKHLNSKMINRIPEKSKNFRLADKNSKKNKQPKTKILILKGNISDASSNPSFKNNELINMRNQYGNIGSSHKSKSLISLASDTKFTKNHIFEVEKIKKNMVEKAFEAFCQLEYKKKLTNFFVGDKIYNNDNTTKPQIKIEIDAENFDVRNRIEKIKKYDSEINVRKYKEWSAQQVMNWPDNEQKYIEWNKAILKIEDSYIILWSLNGFKRFLNKVRYYLFLFSISTVFDLFIIFIVLLNIISMLISGNLFDPELGDLIQLSNYGFNGVFMFEFVVKFIGIGPILYFSDPFTFLDLAIIGFAILDMATSAPTVDITIEDTTNGAKTSNIASQLAFLRVFRIFRVMRIAKVLKKIKHFRVIIAGITNSIYSVAYNLLICFIFLLIFQLLGMSLLNSDPNYQSFMPSLYVTFQILTLENWNLIYYNLSYMNRLSVLYLLTWIFLGNYILFNLFISILLNSFESNPTDEENAIPENMPEEFQKLELLERESRLSRISNNNTKSKDNNQDSDEDEEEDEEDKHVAQDSFSNYIGVKKFIKQREIINQVFKDNECEYSLFIFSQTNSFRLWCVDVITYKKFDSFILIMILLSTVRLIIDTFVSGSLSEVIFDMVDIFFTIVFLAEMILKIISLGFILGHGTYLKDNWNRIDFIIVCVSLIDFQSLLSKYTTGKLSNSSLNFLKVLRLLRTLRPLRFISHNVQLKIIITSLFDSIIPISNVLIIVVVVLIVFSIVGMNLFYDMYHTCYTIGTTTPFQEVKMFNNVTYNSMIEATSACNKLGGTMDAAPVFKFSNILNSLITAYVLANAEGWPDVMNSYNAFNIYYGIFFIAYWFIVSTFFMNLFVGILFSSFNDAWNKENKQEITENPETEQYWDFLKQIEIAEPEWSKFKKPTGKFRILMYSIVQSSILDNFIMFVIVCNMVTMAMSFQGMTESYEKFLEIINLIFTSIFVTECIMKLSALGIKGYFHFGWNKFDFFVVASSILDLVVSYAFGGNNIAFLKSFQIFRVLRVLRVTRVLRLVKSLKGLEKLLQTLRWSINALMNVFILLFLIFCIFSIVGFYLFNDVSYHKHPERFQNYNAYYNFDNFYNAFILCFRTATGENWPLIMVEVAFCKIFFNFLDDPEVVSPSVVFFYFIIMNFITFVIMLNLFLLVTLQQYDDFHSKKTNPIEKFNEILDSFKQYWNVYSFESDNGYRIKNDSMTSFIIELQGDFNKQKNKRVDIIKKYIMDLGLLNDEENYVYFHDVLFKMIKYEYGKDLDKKSQIILKEEDKLIKSINLKIDNFAKLRRKNNYLNTFNPLTTHLYYKVSFKFMKQFLLNYLETSKDKNFTNNNNFFADDEDKLLIKNQSTERKQNSRKTGLDQINENEMRDEEDLKSPRNFSGQMSKDQSLIQDIEMENVEIGKKASLNKNDFCFNSKISDNKNESFNSGKDKENFERK